MQINKKNARVLGIDYGRSKIGLALAEGSLAEPRKVIFVKSFEDAIKRIEKEIEIEKPEKVIVGISEGEMGKETGEFRKRLEKEINIPIEEFDETLTSEDAKRLSIEAGIGQKKRHEMEDAYAAAIMLQGYLDS
jgi:putative Holliday junction resolvase